jgi:hypothetical protein
MITCDKSLRMYNDYALCMYVLALRIHLSEDAQQAITQFPGYVVESRGQTYVKVNVFHCESVRSRSS